MASAQAKLSAALGHLQLHSPRVPVIANVTARPHEGPATIGPRLVEQVTSSVRWEDSIRFLLAQGFSRFIELGPGTALTGFLKRIDKNVTVFNVADVPSLAATVHALS